MSDDSFEKVIKMIKYLIVKFMVEANVEAEQKGWCDDELASNEQIRKEKMEAVEMLHAKIDEPESSVAKLGEDIAELSQTVADLDAAMAMATDAILRNHARKTSWEFTSMRSTAGASASASAKSTRIRPPEQNALLCVLGPWPLRATRSGPDTERADESGPELDTLSKLVSAMIMENHRVRGRLRTTR